MLSFRNAALVLSLALAAAGCSGDPEPAPGGSEPPAGQSPPPSAAPTAGYVKEGWTGPANPVRVRLEIGAVERHGERTLLRYYVTNLDERPARPDLAAGLTLPGYASLTLLDPVGGKAYLPVRDASGRQAGSETRRGRYAPGVRYEHVLLFPGLPAGLGALTVLTNSTAGEFTGIPVTEGSGPLAPTAPPVPAAGQEPVSGETYSWPLRSDTGGAAEGEVVDLYGLTETATASTRSGSGDEQVGLRTDVLFALDSDKLSPDAKDVLDDVAAEIEARAEPQLEITGHTDDSGLPSYNLKLSDRRAQAVLRELKARLGDGFKYLAKGEGESDPAVKPNGPDDDEARARNRRVEVDYELRPQEPPPGVNAPFRAADGPVAASREVKIERLGRTTTRRIDVRPFYRDGSHLVAVFEITNLGPDRLSGALSNYEGVNGGEFGQFTVVDPATSTRYGSVRLGPERATGRELYADPGETVFRVDPDTANRGFFYVPAPPASVTSVTFEAGPFGTFEDIPVQ